MAHAVRTDEVASDRRRCAKRDLLRRDRDDECLEGLRIQRRTEPGERGNDRPEDRVVHGPGAERCQIEGETEQPADLFCRRLAPRLDAHASGRSFDPHLVPADDPVESTLVQDRRSVRAEVAKARGREAEVVRLGDPQNHRPRR